MGTDMTSFTGKVRSDEGGQITYLNAAISPGVRPSEDGLERVPVRIRTFDVRESFRSDLSIELAQKLIQAAGDLPPVADASNATQVTSAFLLHLGGTVGEPLSEVALVGLERLSCKVDIARNVWASYDLDWSKPLDKTSIKPEVWRALVLAFLYGADAVLRRDRKAKGRSLQLVNSAYNALDQCRQVCGNDQIDVLQGYCIRTLEKIVAW